MLKILKTFFPKALLSVHYAGRPVVDIPRNKALPLERRLVLSLATLGAPPELICVASDGSTTVYDLRTYIEEGWAYLHLSVRISPEFALQMDGLFSRDGRERNDASSDTPGVRLQPFVLPEGQATAPDFVGCGTLARGLNYSGWITPSSVSMIGVCDACRRSFRFRCYYVGMSEEGYLYCGSGQHTLMFGRGEVLTEPLPCDACEGMFAEDASFRCPHCRAAYIDLGHRSSERERYVSVHHGTEVQRLPQPSR